MGHCRLFCIRYLCDRNRYSRSKRRRLGHGWTQRSYCSLQVLCRFSACFLHVLSFPWSLSYLWVCSELVRVCSECVLSCIDHVAVISSVWKWAEWKISKKFRRLKDEESSLRLQAHHDQTIRMIFGWRRLLSPEQTTEPIHNMQVRHWNQTMIPSSGQTFDDDELIFEYFFFFFFLRMDTRTDGQACWFDDDALFTSITSITSALQLERFS